MAAYFFDSSALVKRYVQEDGTRWVRNLTRQDPQTRIYLARITVVEVTSAVARRRKGKEILPKKASSILYRFRQHLAGRYSIVDITSPLLDEAATLANAHKLRAYDAVQLAAVLEVRRLRAARGLEAATLVSSDGPLNQAAMAEGMTVENPRDHP